MKILFIVMLLLVLFPHVARASNPIIRETKPGKRVYCGDPAAMVVDTDGDGEGDKVYLYVGEDAGDKNNYYMPNYLCYSSTDMVNWSYEGIPLRASDFSWGSEGDAWASQVIEYKGKYYFYNSKNSSGMSVAVSDSPTGPFVDARDGSKLVEPDWTKGKVTWDDIDPTVWVEVVDGEEHRYLMWGNSNLYMVELNEDMISFEGEAEGITELTINGIPEDSQYTEAPWIYKRKGDDRYYVFFASNWPEELSYAVADNIWGPYEYKGLVMGAGASCNGNHPAIIDFKGQTYIFYHTSAQPNGGGYNRSVCIDRLYFDESGNVAQLEESSIGLDGTAVKITLNGKKLSQVHFDNFPQYPMGTTLRLGENSLYPTDSLWEIAREGDRVCIQAVNKMGYYITEYNGAVKLLHDDDGTEASKLARTFIPVEAEGGVAYESASSPGKYLSVDGSGNIILSHEPSYFKITEGAKQSLNVRAEGEEIVAMGTSEPFAELVVVINGPDKTAISYVKTDEKGSFAYSFTPEKTGTYRITAAGRVAEVEY